MSSLLQFDGKIDKRGVHLMALKGIDYDIIRDGYKPYHDLFEDLFDCPICGKKHPVIYTFIRKPRGTFGPWVVFRWNNTDHVPDLSTPMTLTPNERPKDMKRMSDIDAAKYWHS